MVIEKKSAALSDNQAATQEQNENLDINSIPFEAEAVKVFSRTVPAPAKREPLLTDEDVVKAFLRGHGAYMLVPGDHLAIRFSSSWRRPGPLSKGVPYFIAWLFLRSIEAETQAEQVQSVIQWARGFTEVCK
ncbi:MAG TPA: hypothetical protein PLG43_02820 [Spirochaetia bacterium]|nr:hypothetical protein [Spirochaetia bacterium]